MRTTTTLEFNEYTNLTKEACIQISAIIEGVSNRYARELEEFEKNESIYISSGGEDNNLLENFIAVDKILSLCGKDTLFSDLILILKPEIEKAKEYLKSHQWLGKLKCAKNIWKKGRIWMDDPDTNFHTCSDAIRCINVIVNSGVFQEKELNEMKRLIKFNMVD